MSRVTSVEWWVQKLDWSEFKREQDDEAEPVRTDNFKVVWLKGDKRKATVA